MKLYKTHNVEVIKRKEFAMGSIVLEVGNGIIIVCRKFTRKTKPEFYIYQNGNWRVTCVKNQFTDLMRDFYYQEKSKEKKRIPCCANMMKHDRRHKNGGGGSRINNYAITDYECSSHPLHDFRRVYN